ncbi:MAG: hypothetical protein IIZ66_03750 [Clostridia bacterium]|nr:hypothetical protein [Clostridia bacterium]
MADVSVIADSIKNNIGSIADLLEKVIKAIAALIEWFQSLSAKYEIKAD